MYNSDMENNIQDKSTCCHIIDILSSGIDLFRKHMQQNYRLDSILDSILKMNTS